jgi:hypothetical protein
MSTALGTVEPDVDLDDGGSVVLQNLLKLAFLVSRSPVAMGTPRSQDHPQVLEG